MTFTVQVDNKGPVGQYPTAAEALEFARRQVYLNPERVTDMEALLQAGQIAEWSYGFIGIAIYPSARA